MYVALQSPVLAFVSASNSYSAPSFTGDSGTLSGSMNFTVTASGDDIYIATTTATPFTVRVVASDGAPAATTTGVSVSFAQPSNVTTATIGGATYYKIAEGQSATFNLSISISSADMTETGYYYFDVSNIAWRFGADGTAGTAVNYLDTTVWRTPDANVTKL